MINTVHEVHATIRAACTWAHESRRQWRQQQLTAASAASRAAGGDPFKFLLWLANAPRPAGGGLPAGTVVTTGSLKGMTAAGRGVSRGVYGALGTVEVEFV